MGSLVERQALPSQRLLHAVSIVRRRWRLRHVLFGATIVTAITGAVLALASVLMERAGFSATSISVARIIVGLAALAATIWYVVIPWLRRVPDERVALYVEENVPQLDGAMVSAVEATRMNLPDDVRSSALTAGLVRSATEQLRRHGDAAGIETRGLRKGGLWFAGAVAVAVTLFAFGP